ncbi:MAG TPA: hypothetical protein VMD04_02465 [Candidatus Margulisiibacteriota bacterium]|nr:hypothetical protein [Candidatus Margulisiibacteriota bacterium]
MKKVKTSPKGRRCKFPHCHHTLSIYNHEAYCHVHLSGTLPKHKAKS